MQDIPKLYTALAEWLSCMTIVAIYRKGIEKGSIPALCLRAAGSLALLCGLQLLCGMVSNVLWIAGMGAAVLVMILTIRSCLDISWNGAAYACARAFLFGELVAALEWQLFFFYFWGKGSGIDLPGVLFCFLLYGCCFSLWYYAERRSLPEEWEKSWLPVTKKQLCMVWLSAALIFALSNMSYISVVTPFTGTGATEIYNIRTLIDLAGFIMLEAFYIQKNDADRKAEIAAVRNILRSQYMQFRESQENIELIHRKYHDLKHQLQVLREEPDHVRRGAYLDEIEQGIRRYEAENKTGNSVLDTVLTSKSYQCLKHHITMTVVADGSLLNHIAVMDLCTIFGNALDNAIEHEVQIQDRDKRLIHVSLSSRQELICILVENYFEGTQMPEGGMPKTTKRDKRYHGYGLKSIRYSVEKYGGHMNMKVHDGWFRLEILMPRKTEGEGSKTEAL